MTEEPERSVRNKIRRKTIIQSRESESRHHTENKRHKTITVDPYQTRRTIYCKKILRRKNKERLNQSQQIINSYISIPGIQIRD